MSGHSAGLARATRVASRKLGPVGGSRSPPSARVAWATSTLATTWGRCETAAIMRSWVSASIAAGRAPEDEPRRGGGRRQVPQRPVEGALGGVRDARPLPPGGRVPADEALVAV